LCIRLAKQLLGSRKRNRGNPKMVTLPRLAMFKSAYVAEQKFS